MENTNVVTIKTEAARNDYLRVCPAAELSNEDLLDAQRATADDIEKDGTDHKLRARYNALATEYGVRYNRGEQLISEEDVARRERDLKWFFESDAVSIDDEDFQAYITEEGQELSPADGLAMFLSRPVSLAGCDELPPFIHLIERRLSGMDGNEDGYEFLDKRLKALRAADMERHGNGKPYEPDQSTVNMWLYQDTTLEYVYSQTPADIFIEGIVAEVGNTVMYIADTCFGADVAADWVGEITDEQCARLAAEGIPPDLTTRTLEDTFKDGMRFAESQFNAIHEAVHEYAEKNNIPHVGTD